MRLIYFVCGLLCVLLGAVGALLPLVPTTPFLILAAFCFSRSSERLHRWLLSRPSVGPVIRDWEEHGIISLPAKRIATGMIVLLVSYPIIFITMPSFLKALIAVTIAFVLMFIWTRPSARGSGTA